MQAVAALVCIQNVFFAYGRSAALENVSLDIQEGVVVGMIGPNGGGKTTLLKLLLGELSPDAGHITVAGLSPKAAVRRGDLVGYLPQHGHRVGTLPVTVRQVVRLGLTGKAGFMKRPALADLAFADEMINRAGLRALADKPVQSLSGGQLQRAYIARALAPRPRLLLLDEPTTGIDRASQARLIELVAELRRELKLTVVLVSHDLRTVTGNCDRVACLNGSLHYHDVPGSFPEELARGMFCCDLEAMGLGHGVGDAGHTHCPHDGYAGHTAAGAEHLGAIDTVSAIETGGTINTGSAFDAPSRQRGP